MLVVAFVDLGTEQMGLAGIGSFTQKQTRAKCVKCGKLWVPFIFFADCH